MMMEQIKNLDRSMMALMLSVFGIPTSDREFRNFPSTIEDAFSFTTIFESMVDLEGGCNGAKAEKVISFLITESTTEYGINKISFYQSDSKGIADVPVDFSEYPQFYKDTVKKKEKQQLSLFDFIEERMIV